MQPFGMLQSVLAWRLQIADDDDTETVRRKIVEGIAPLFDEDGLAQAHLLGQLVGVDFSASPHVRGIAGDARQIRNRAFHAAAQVLRRTAQRSGAPLLLLLDDLHWADDGSLDFISYLEQVNRDVPMLLLCMTRPTLFERRPDWALLYGTHQRIELQALDKRGSRELVGVLLQRLDKVPAALRELLIGGAEGNPFYMEELVRMLVDNGAIVTGPERWHLVADKLLGAQVPPTLTGVLQARVDSLPPREKLTLQQASVIGVAFWDQALAAIDPEAPLALHSLVQRGLLVPHENTTLEGQREFAFKNQVLHQVIYDGLLRRDRRGWHACIAGWLGRIEDSRAREARGLAAQHYERAGDPVQACRFYTRAAEDAAARYANSAMLTFVERALALADPADHETRWRAHLVRERHLLDTTERAAHDADLQALAHRVHDLVGWHTELYLDASDLPDLEPVLAHLPHIAIDHLGLRDDPTGALLRLVERGAVVKATGLGRIRHRDPGAVARAVLAANPAGLVFGTDLPSTRAATPYTHDDLDTIVDWLDPAQFDAVTHGNAQRLYRTHVQPRDSQ